MVTASWKAGVFAAILVLSLVLLTGCAGRGYPPTPDVGTGDQQARLAELTRAAARETDQARRAHLLADLGQLIRSMPRTSTEHEAMRRYVVRVVHASIRNHEHSLGHRSPFGLATEVSDLPEWLPRELIGLRITTGADWVNEFYNEPTGMPFIHWAGGLQTDGRTFRHVEGVLNTRSLPAIYESDEFDLLISEMVRVDPRAAALQLLRLEDRPEDREGHIEVQLLLAEMQVRFEHLRRRSRLQRAGPPADVTPRPYPYDQPTAETMLRLAERPEWQAHLCLTYYLEGTADLRDEAVIRRLAEHQHPITMRFLRRKLLIDEQGNPRPKISPTVPEGFRRPDPEPAGPE